MLGDPRDTDKFLRARGTDRLVRPDPLPQAKTFWAAIISQATDDLISITACQKPFAARASARFAADTRRWFFDKSDIGPGSLNACAEILQINPNAIRERAREICRMSIVELGLLPRREERGLNRGGLRVDDDKVAAVASLLADGAPHYEIQRETHTSGAVIARIRAVMGIQRSAVCSICGRIFRPATKGFARKVCSEKCWMRNHLFGQRQRRLSCLGCGVEFAPNDPKQTYRTRKCWKRADYRAHRIELLEQMRVRYAERKAKAEEEIVTPDQEFWAGILLTAHHDLLRSAELKPLFAAGPGIQWTPAQRDEIYDWWFKDNSDATGLAACCAELAIDITRVRAFAQKTVDGDRAIAVIHARQALTLTTWEPAPAAKFGLANP